MINSQTASAPQFTQKQNRDNPRVGGLCMLTRPLAGLFCFEDCPKWYYWFSASCEKRSEKLLNIWSPWMLWRKSDCRSPVYSRMERAWKPFTIKRELLEMKYFILSPSVFNLPDKWERSAEKDSGMNNKAKIKTTLSSSLHFNFSQPLAHILVPVAFCHSGLKRISRK